jgi:hypothetical protein
MKTAIKKAFWLIILPIMFHALLFGIPYLFLYAN